MKKGWKPSTGLSPFSSKNFCIPPSDSIFGRSYAPPPDLIRAWGGGHLCSLENHLKQTCIFIYIFKYSAFGQNLSSLFSYLDKTTNTIFQNTGLSLFSIYDNMTSCKNLFKSNLFKQKTCSNLSHECEISDRKKKKNWMKVNMPNFSTIKWKR